MKRVIKFSIIVSLFTAFYFVSCKKDHSCERCKETNKPPIAIAGSDQVITLPTDSILLDGKNSSDSDGKISKWLWTKISGPASFTITKPSDSTTMIRALVVGTYQFELKVTDNGGLSAKDTMQLIVDSIVITKHPPIANAGTDITIILPTNTANLDGRGSTDPDNDITSYVWTVISGPSSFNIANTNSVQTQITNLVQGVYLVELKVTDAGGLLSKDTMRLTVNPATNHSPIANAGPDQTIILPTNTANLDGSGSIDPENNITTYIWTKISGPSSFNIVTANSVRTQVTILVQGVYQFELKVTDAGGLFSKDTVQITVQIVVPPPLNCDITNRPIGNVNLTFSSQLPEPRYGVTVATVGNKIFIAGGYTSYTGGGPSNYSSKVDIYDVTTSQWTITQLSEPRAFFAVAVLGNKIFFAGGQNTNGLRTTVDIYDVSSNTWSITQLSQARTGMMAGSINNKVLFAGGVNIPDLFSVVDIYSTATNSWSAASLSAARYSPPNFVYSTPNPPTVGQKIYFAGGQICWIQDCPTNRIDIYDAAANTWSYEDYNPHIPGTYLFSGISAGNKNYWVTGDYWEGGNLVEIRDEITHTTSYECLSGVLYGHPVNNGNKLIFPVSSLPMPNLSYTLSHFDVYDLSTNTWSISNLAQPGVDLRSFISINNEVYAFGGSPTSNGFFYDKIYDKLYKLKF